MFRITTSKVDMRLTYSAAPGTKLVFSKGERMSSLRALLGYYVYNHVGHVRRSCMRDDDVDA